MRDFLIFYAYREMKPSGETKFANFIMEAATFPDKNYVKENCLENMQQYAGKFRFEGITGIVEVHKAEVPSYE